MASSNPPASENPTPIIRSQNRSAQFFREDRLTLAADQLPLDMVYIPPGTFLMGSPEDELERSDNERPQHEVTFAESFFMGRYPVTQAQWRAVAALPQSNQELDSDPSAFKGDNRPVEQVSWDDAMEFCHRLAKATGRPYRLPSEAEWEYACRAGTTTAFHFGETITPDLANYDGNYSYGEGPQGVYRNETTPVSHFDIANRFGLSDMHGNAWEWCSDPWNDNYEVASIDGTSWKILGAFESNLRVLRGGSWFSSPGNCRSAWRFRYARVDRYDDLGFRLCCGFAMT